MIKINVDIDLLVYQNYRRVNPEIVENLYNQVAKKNSKYDNLVSHCIYKYIRKVIRKINVITSSYL